MTDNKNSLGPNSKLGFLYKKCTIKPYVISKIAHVPEYMDALLSYEGSLDDYSVYSIIRDTYKKMYEQNKGHDLARSILKQVSRDVTGDPQTWRNEI